MATRTEVPASQAVQSEGTIGSRWHAEVELWSDSGLSSATGEVLIERGEIVFEHDTGDGPVVYRGREEGEGHYHLRCDEPDVDGEGTLHRFKNSKVLEGFWKERNTGWGRGMWRVTLRPEHHR